MHDPLETSPSPLVIGVSGHRDVQPESAERIKREVGAFLEQIQSRTPHCGVRIMVGMAQGADLLVAQLALERGLGVDAVLPMSLDQYADDFEPDSLSLLRSMRRHPNVRWIELAPPAEETAALVRTVGGDPRDALYANLTNTLIRKSSLLLALWDGQASPLPGGTADTVLRYLDVRTHPGRDQRSIGFLEPDGDSWAGSQFVYWIPTPRSSSGAISSTQPRYLSGIGESLLGQHSTMPKELQHQIAELNDYNHEFQRLRARGQHARLDTLLPTLPAEVPPDERQTFEAIDAEYGRADALAIYHQKHSDRVFRWFSYMASCMALLFLVYAKLVASSALLYAYLTVFVFSLAMFYWVRQQHWFSKHLVYRVLAETMRTKFFLRLAGADRLVNAAELINLTGINQFSGFSWIGNVLKNVEPLDQQHTAAEGVKQHQLQCVDRHWIRGQQAYFKSKVKRLELTNRRLEKMKTALVCGIVFVTLLLVFFADALKTKLVGTVSFKDVFIFLMGLLPVWLGIWELYQNKMATRELLWQYKNQLSHFSRAQLQLSRSSARDRHEGILAELGKESLMESYLWTIHRYHREHEPPTAG